MKASDYIVEYLAGQGISDVFGYPGGMVIHLMDSFDKTKSDIRAHVNYHEQASAFAACGYAQVSMKPGMAYATSGPGATNLITGICNAYFDSVPVLFITGQVNTNESKKGLLVRQKGFQETDIIAMIQEVTKYAAYVEKAEDLKYHLEKAIQLSLEGRPGPVLLDIPMNVQRTEIDPDRLAGYEAPVQSVQPIDVQPILGFLKQSKRPCILIGSGIKTSGSVQEFRALAENMGVPVVCSMLSFDVMPYDSNLNFGFIGAYGNRHSNFILAKSDLVIALGSRLDVRQIGGKKEGFAPDARLIRVEIDPGELTNKVKEDEIQIVGNVKDIIREFSARFATRNDSFEAWLAVCSEIKTKLVNRDIKEPNLFVDKISRCIPDHLVITTDVGQNQVWIAQSFVNKNNQRVLFSGGHGAMGYSLPAAIGATYASKKTVICFTGDGGFQMNIQELQFIAREKLPIKIVVLNNSALGMIRHFQEMYLESNYTQTVPGKGYTTPDFGAVAKAYGLDYALITDVDQVSPALFEGMLPTVIEVKLQGDTYVFPKLEFGKPNQDQEPLIDRSLYDYLMKI